MLLDMKLRQVRSNSIHYERAEFILPDSWTVGNLIDWVILSKLENGDTVLSIKLVLEDEQ